MIQRDKQFKENGVYHAIFSPLVLIPTNKYRGRRRIWRLAEQFTVKISHLGGSSSLTVPKGWETDLASIPIILTPFVGARDAVGVAEASVVHDFLCDHYFPSFFANAHMRIIMEVCGAPGWKCKAVFYALMLFGFGSPIFNWLTLGRFKRDAQYRKQS